MVVEGATADKFVAATKEALAKTGPQVMLTEGIARAYHQGQARMKDRETVRPVTEMVSEGRSANPNLYETTAGQFLADHVLSEEVFGPLGLVVRVETPEEMHRIALSFQGQLTATLHMDEGDLPLAKRLLPVLERKAGRVLVNGYPTGVEVVDSMVHGGPYPASTNFGATSVGTLSIRRFLRPVSYQNFPAGLLPEGVL